MDFVNPSLLICYTHGTPFFNQIRLLISPIFSYLNKYTNIEKLLKFDKIL